MSNIKKLMMSAAAGGGLDVDEVFQIFTYTGNSSSSKTISNGIDLSTEGGMVWSKNRISAENWICCDTERGAGKILQTNRTDTEFTNTNIVSSFTTSGYTVGSDIRVNSSVVQDHCSYTFREHPDFFQIKTFTTSYNTDPHTLTHDLECDLGMAIFKSLNNSSQANNWVVWHKDLAALNAANYIRLNDNVGYLQDSANPIEYNSSTKTFSFNYPMSEAGDRLIAGNQENTNYVGYFFGHHNNNGTFGASGDQDIIKTGIYTGNGNTSGFGPEINLGWEPQFVMIKRINQNTYDNWLIFDNNRVPRDNVSRYPYLRPGANSTEYFGDQMIMFTGRGFRPISGQSGVNTNGNSYIYMAIRRGPMSPPKSSTDVFNVDYYTTGSKINLGWEPDMLLFHELTNNPLYNGRLFFRKMGNTYNLVTNSDAAYNGSNEQISWDNSTPNDSTSPEFHSDFADGQHYFWKQAPEFFSQQVYRGSGTGSQYIYHGLGTTPEMIWIKNLTNASGQDWIVWHKDLTSGYRIDLQDSDPETTASGYGPFNMDTEKFLVSSQLDNNSHYYGVMCWASVPGVSKVGSFSHTISSSTTVDCGFSNGPKFVFIKKYNSGTYGSWRVYDSDRGIVAGNDPVWYLDTGGHDTGSDQIDPTSSGFSLPANYHGTPDYIFYAVRA